MKKSIEVKAQSVELAIEDGLNQLNTTKDRVDVEVLSEGGLFSKAQVRLTLKPTAAEVVEDFCNNLLEKMHIKAQAIVTEEDSVIKIDIMGDEASHAIGYRGETLDAIQYLALTVLNQGHQFKKVVVNTGCYREKREQTLISLANRLADKAYRTGKKVVLEPMNPFERHHSHGNSGQCESHDGKRGRRTSPSRSDYPQKRRHSEKQRRRQEKENGYAQIQKLWL